MKHRRGIDLASLEDEAVEIDCTTLQTLPAWYALFAECESCQHQLEIDRWEIARQCGKGLRLAEIARRLKCQCGNRRGNRLMLGRLPVILHREDYVRWLWSEPDPSDLMRPFPAELMTMWQIGKAVGASKNNTLDIIEEIYPDPEPSLI